MDATSKACSLCPWEPRCGWISRLDSEHVKVTAMVRTCDPGVGNGIEFTGMPASTKKRMQAYLDVIDPQMKVAAPNGK